ncbi:unnamed protein product [Phytomonas sp. Hart1]|nr:unnamed protein product [Phytomonas sp. Hart1]|eukprot:CCW67637.1 unnamed protein product [Phytomonas sp. isolate Hart1]
MYLPKLPQSKRRNHFSFDRSKQDLYTTTIITVVILISAVLITISKMRGRERQSQFELSRKHQDRRVVILGAGLGGCALAATLCNADPELHVTVVERSRRQVFQGIVPLAHVGHRSYDLNTTGGVDFLTSPVTWNITRRADMVLGEVLKVRPDSQEVIVRVETEGRFANPKGAISNKETENSSPWWRRLTRGSTPITRNSDGTIFLPDGCVSYPYDVLVVASGAQRDLGPLKNSLSIESLDSYRIAVNPGVTRDSLVHLFKGNVLHIKVPPASFVSQIEAIRKKLLPPAIRVSEEELKAVSRVNLEKDDYFPLLATLTEKASTDETHGNAAPTPSITTNSFLKAWCSCKRQTHAAALSSESNPDESPSPNFAPYMHYAARQHESTFVSSTNLIWKFLEDFSKFSFCTLYTIVADAEPMGSAPDSVNKIIRDHWLRMQKKSYRVLRPTSVSNDLENGTMPEKTLAEQRFFFLSHIYPINIDLLKNEVTLYNYAYNALISLPYGLILLDLPVHAPSFIRESGLHRTHYAKEHVPSFLSTGWWHAVASKMANHADHPNALEWMKKVRRMPAVRDCFGDEEGFMDVFPDTLQHCRYENIFALGDAAGLPTMKSYGSTLAQVPVVLHNILQVIHKQKILQRLAEVEMKNELGTSRGGVKSSALALTPHVESQGTPPGGIQIQGNIPEANARYDGYTSFHLAMSIWRAMWPEMKYNRSQIDAFKVFHQAIGTGSRTKKNKGKLPFMGNEDPFWVGSRPLKYCNYHIWDNLAWKDHRGFLNALFYQSFLYEILFFFMLTSGAWYPPGWFFVPRFSPVDGSIEPTRSKFDWL